MCRSDLIHIFVRSFVLQKKTNNDVMRIEEEKKSFTLPSCLPTFSVYEAQVNMPTERTIEKVKESFIQYVHILSSLVPSDILSAH